MKNQVIEVLNKEHGKKVIEYWKSEEFDTGIFEGSQAKSDNSTFRFYGVINGIFGNYNKKTVDLHNAEIIKLPTESPKEEEKPFPRVMFVSDDGNSWNKRVVFMKKCDKYISWVDAETIEESEIIYKTTYWRYAKELTEKVEIKKSQIADKFGIPIDLIKIVD